MKLASIFRDHMVIQAGKPIRVFGSGKGMLTIDFLGLRYQENVGEKWCVSLAAADHGGPYSMRIRLDDETVVLKDIMVGEVVLLAGQSNAQFMVLEEENEVPPCTDNAVRFFGVHPFEEEYQGLREEDGWQQAGADGVRRWSAIGHHVGKALREKYGCAIGVVGCYQGASIIQSWVEEGLVCTLPAFDIPMRERHQNYETEEYLPYLVWNHDGQLYREVFLRIAPYAFSRVIWYQGESNTGVREGENYLEMLRAFIENWRGQLLDKTLPFTVVVIADLDSRRDEGWQLIQAAQRRATEIPFVSTVESADCCDSSTIHPTNKKIVSDRIVKTFFA